MIAISTATSEALIEFVDVAEPPYIVPVTKYQFCNNWLLNWFITKYVSILEYDDYVTKEW